MKSASGGLRSHWQRSIGLLAAVALLVPLLATGASAQNERQPWEGLDNVGNGNAAPVGAGFTLTPNDVEFILDQIRISEAHVQTSTALDPCGTLVGPDPLTQIPAGDLTQPWGLRVLDGSCNNLFPGNETWGAADQPFIELIAPDFPDAEPLSTPFAPPPNMMGNPTTYANPGAGLWVEDSQPRVISNLVSDQTANNPAAAAVGIDEGDVTLNIENVAPDMGLSAPFNDMLTFFGQFFDHGLDLTTKNGAPVYMPLKEDDPLFVPGGNNFMILSRGQDGSDPTNVTTPYVDQNQTYSSHPSHQVFLRDYVDSGGAPVSSGRLLEDPDGGMATWATLKAQAAAELGFRLEDHDVHNVPLLATDQYGNFIPGPNGFPQVVSPGSPGGLFEGDPGVDGLGIALPADTMRTGHGFILDLAHLAAPGTCDDDANPGTPEVPQTPDADGAANNDDGDPCTYDDELLDAHFIAGDGRVNENLALTAVHHVFHSEHNRLVDDILVVAAAGGPALEAEFTGLRAAGEFKNGERLFQAAKFVNEMEYQHLAFEEFSRTISPLVHVFDNYDTSINSAIFAEFAHAVYRFGHSMLNENVMRFDADGTPNNMTLVDAFLNPTAFRQDSNGLPVSPEEAAGALWRGGVTQVGQEIDEFLVDALRNDLLGLPLDLGSLNIARGRDNGLATLQEVRAEFWANGLRPELEPYESWADFKFELKTPDSIVNFVAAYGTHDFLDLYDPDGLGPIEAGSTEARREMADIILNQPGHPQRPADAADFIGGTGMYAVDKGGLDNVDLWIGGLAELREFETGSMLGTTFDFIFRTQMENLQDGDRFYYLHRLGGTNLLTQLEGNSLSEMAERNTTAMGLPANVFSRPDFTFDLTVQDQDPVNQPAPVVDDPATGYLEPELLDREADGTLRFWQGGITGGAAAAGVNGGEHTNWIGTAFADDIRSGDGDDTIRGNDGDDRIEGEGGADNIIGGEGDDIITDRSGDDDIKSGPGDDAVSGGPGVNLLQGGPGDDYVLAGNDDGNEILAGPGDDIIHGGASGAGFVAGEGDDWIQGGGGADGVEADDANPLDIDPEGGNDVINGEGGDDRMEGEGGDDIFFQSDGINRIEGILGFDWQVQSYAADLANTIALGPPFQEDRFFQVEGLSGTSGDDQLNGDDAPAVLGTGLQALDAAGIALIDGLADVLPVGTTLFEDGNIILGGSGDDLLQGRGGDDVLDGDVYLDVYLLHNPPGGPATRYDDMLDAQSDIFDGLIDPGHFDIVREIVLDPGAGADTDVAIFQGAAAEYTVTLVGDRVIVAHTNPDPLADPLVDDGTDTLRNIETLRFTDGDVPAPSADTCNGLAITIDANLLPPGTVTGTPGDDVILGTPLADVILGGGGNDTICGGDGNDTINGQAGVDTIFGEGDDDTIFGEAPADGDFDDVIFGGAGDDMLFGFGGNDTINGGTGVDRIQGGLGNDILNGDDGDDVMNGGAGLDTMTGGVGNDNMLGDDDADVLDGGVGNDTVNGGTGDDDLSGGDGDDIVFGFDGDDVALNGGDGADLVIGGLGNDTIDLGPGGTVALRDFGYGSEGNDIMSAPSGLNTFNGGPDNDTITGGVDADIIFGDGALVQAGNDILDGGAGEDSVFGLAGDDQITATDGELDTIFGQDGTDTCFVDGGLATPAETVVGGCELE